MQLPVCREGQTAGSGFAFGVDERVGGQPAVRFQGGAGGDQQVLVKRGVEEHQVEGRLGRTGEQRQGVLLAHFAALALQGLQMAAQGGDHLTAHVAGQGVGGAAGQRLQRQCPAAGEQVEAAGAFDMHAQPVEQGFAHPVRGGPQARLFGKAEAPAAPLPGDDAQLALAGLGLFHTSGSGMTLVSASGAAASGSAGAVS